MGKLKAWPSELREAVVHFELYRCLMNSISSEKQFYRIRYVGVEPEVPVGGGSADLVVKAEMDSSPTHFLVIEVKRRKRLGLPVFDDDAREQAKEYAKGLSALYYAITDGQRLRLFKTPDEPVANYAFSLDEGSAKQFLRGLLELQTGKRSGLPFNTVHPPLDEIEKLSKGFTKMLLDLLEELSSKGAIVLTKHRRVQFLTIGHHKGVLRLGVSEEPDKA